MGFMGPAHGRELPESVSNDRREVVDEFSIGLRTEADDAVLLKDEDRDFRPVDPDEETEDTDAERTRGIDPVVLEKGTEDTGRNVTSPAVDVDDFVIPNPAPTFEAERSKSSEVLRTADPLPADIRFKRPPLKLGFVLPDTGAADELEDVDRALSCNHFNC
ncbi:hypothetical protein HK102_009629 [Quaeritorhiza haematococci]|nr:hypothetical protein HK102_009629 [Quaeritorhiza haematococci]